MLQTATIRLELGHNAQHLGGVPVQQRAGYLIERSLSIDNVFVFAVIFASFAIPSSAQGRLLSIGIVMALVMRAAPIGAFGAMSFTVGKYGVAALVTLGKLMAGVYLTCAAFVFVVLAGILAAFWGMMLGFPVLRLRGDYLAIVTLAFGEIIRLVIVNWQSLTGGPNGISAIPRPSFFGLEFNASCGAGSFCGFFGIEHSPMYRIIWLYYIILALALLTNWVTQRPRTRSPRAWINWRRSCRALKGGW